MRDIEGYLRGTGRTTLIIDAAIQELFTKGEVVVEDHHFGESAQDHRNANKRTFDFLLRRLDIEHGGLGRFIVDVERFRISLKTPKHGRGFRTN